MMNDSLNVGDIVEDISLLLNEFENESAYYGVITKIIPDAFGRLYYHVKFFDDNDVQILTINDIKKVENETRGSNS